MRDLLVTLIVFGSIPFIFMTSWLGLMMYTWISTMNPHRLSWGFAFDYPFAQILAALTIVLLPLDKEKRGIPITPLTIFMALFFLWTVVTTLVSLNPIGAQAGLNKLFKIMLMAFVAMMILTNKLRIISYITVLTFSIGFFGFKGGLFTAATGGAYRVMGPTGTFIGNNNEIAVAFIMTIPLMYFLFLIATKTWQKHMMMAVIITTFVATLGTHSRGALIGLASIAVILILRSKHAIRLFLLLAILGALSTTMMPSHWFERMETISEYEEDGSVQGRFNAWRFAINLAAARPLIGGGFNCFNPENYARYAPESATTLDAHSWLFMVLGNHGYVGLLLYLAAGMAFWLTCGSIRRRTKDHCELHWAHHLATMIQVSFAGWAIAAGVQGMAYFDVYFELLALAVVLQRHVSERLAHLNAITEPIPRAAPDLPTAAIEALDTNPFTVPTDAKNSQ